MKWCFIAKTVINDQEKFGNPENVKQFDEFNSGVRECLEK